LLADEPTGNLDSRTGTEILRVFQKLHQNGTTLILVTHDPELPKWSQRTIAMRDGRVERDTRTPMQAAGSGGSSAWREKA